MLFATLIYQPTTSFRSTFMHTTHPRNRSNRPIITDRFPTNHRIIPISMIWKIKRNLRPTHHEYRLRFASMILQKTPTKIILWWIIVLCLFRSAVSFSCWPISGFELGYAKSKRWQCESNIKRRQGMHEKFVGTPPLPPWFFPPLVFFLPSPSLIHFPLIPLLFPW